MKILLLTPPNERNEPVGRDLIYGCWCHGKRVADAQFPPLNLMYLGTVLKRAGHAVELVDALARKMRLEDLTPYASRNEAVVLSSNNTTLSYDLRVVKHLKSANPDLKSVFTGPHPTVFPARVLGYEGVDYAIQGEAEDTIVEFFQELSSGDPRLGVVRGISYRRDGEPVVNEERPLRPDLDAYPFPDRSLVDPTLYYNPHASVAPFTSALSSRGCVGRCSFCTSHRFYHGRYRARSAGNVLDEMAELEGQGYRDILYRDEVFTENRRRLQDICRGVAERKLRMRWMCNSRVGAIDKESMGMMKEAGCHYLWFGVESGSQRILDNLKKGITIEKTRETFRWAREVGMNTHAHLMFGNPGETKEDVERSIDFLFEIEPTTLDIGITTPFPGTDLFDLVTAADPAIGDATQLRLDQVHNISFFSHHYCNIPGDYLEEALGRAYRRFYLRPGYILNQLVRVKNPREFANAALAGINLIRFMFRKGNKD